MKKYLYILFILQFIYADAYSQCNGSIDLCQKKYNEIAYLTTHNAYNSDQSGLLFPNQTNNIATQLQDGVRGLMIDVYDHFGIPTAYHTVSVLGTIPLENILNKIKLFLDSNPNEIITIIFEAHTSADAIEDIINQVGLFNYIYTYNNTSWPTLQDMIDINKRLVIFSELDDANNSQSWYHYIWDHAVETHYSVNNINDFDCNYNRGDSLNDLFILNHFVTDAALGYGLYNESIDVNSNPFFINRALMCQSEKNKFPNFITVDFYELGDGLDVVNELNNITNTSSINIVDNLFRKEIVNITDILGKETQITKNKILLYHYIDGNVEKKQILE